MNGSVKQLVPVAFYSSGRHPARIEGVLHLPERGGLGPAALVCHPHPLGGGSMDNPVVTAIACALEARGIMALRFNFRGVGQSGGEHDNGRAEVHDVAGALDWLVAQPGVDPNCLSLAGYSFGAWVGLTFAQSDIRIRAAAAVGLVAWHYSGEFYRTKARPDLGVEPWQYDPQFLQSFTRPLLFVSGERDPLSPPREVRLLIERIPEPKRLSVIASATHSLHGCEQQVGELVASFLTNPD